MVCFPFLLGGNVCHGEHIFQNPLINMIGSSLTFPKWNQVLAQSYRLLCKVFSYSGHSECSLNKSVTETVTLCQHKLGGTRSWCIIHSRRVFNSSRGPFTFLLKYSILQYSRVQYTQQAGSLTFAYEYLVQTNCNLKAVLVKTRHTDKIHHVMIRFNPAEWGTIFLTIPRLQKSH